MTSGLDSPILAGLSKVDAMAPGSGFIEFMVGARGDVTGATVFARGEAGLKMSPGSSAFAFAEATMGGHGPAWQAGLAFKATF